MMITNRFISPSLQVCSLVPTTKKPAQISNYFFTR